MEDALIADLRHEPVQGRALQKRSQATRQKIIDAAVATFALRGFDGASTHDIAALAGVNQGLVGYYFGSKRELWRGAIDAVMGEYRNELADGLTGPAELGSRDFYRSVLARYVRWAAENTQVVRILLDINRSDREAAEWYTERHIRPMFDVWTAIIAEGQARGILRPGPVVNIYYHLISTALVFAIPDEAKILTGQDVTSKSFIQDHADVLFRMLMTDAST